MGELKKIINQCRNTCHDHDQGTILEDSMMIIKCLISIFCLVVCCSASGKNYYSRFDDDEYVESETSNQPLHYDCGAGMLLRYFYSSKFFTILSAEGYLSCEDSSVFGSSQCDMFVHWIISEKGYLEDTMGRCPSFLENEEHSRVFCTWDSSLKTVAKFEIINEECDRGSWVKARLKIRHERSPLFRILNLGPDNLLYASEEPEPNCQDLFIFKRAQKMDTQKDF